MRVVVINSGNANACTGQQGMEDARAMVALAGEACGCPENQALVMSTGVIGEFLPMQKIATGIDRAAASLGDDAVSFMAAARGILTTDNSHKVACRSLALAAGEITIAGMAKGAGMIGPNMATMLGVVMTDAVLKTEDAQTILAEAVEESFNCISVEGHMSTNDTVLLLASGAAGGQPLTGDDLQLFQQELKELCIELARMIPDDGEGASHLISIEVRGCSSREDARQIAQTVADSALVKTAIAGADPNWGRIVSAVGYAGVSFDPARLDLTVNGVLLYQLGAPSVFDAAGVSQSIRENRNKILPRRSAVAHHQAVSKGDDVLPGPGKINHGRRDINKIPGSQCQEQQSYCRFLHRFST